MQYYVTNLNELAEWLAARGTHQLRVVTMEALPDMRDEDGIPIQYDINKEWVDETTGETFPLTWAPKEVPAPFVAKLAVAMAEKTGKKWMQMQVLELLDLEIDSAEQEVKPILVRIRKEIKALELRL